MKRAILIYLTIMFLIYLVSAFVIWEFNPHLWGYVARFTYILIGSIPSVLIAAFIYEQEND